MIWVVFQQMDFIQQHHHVHQILLHPIQLNNNAYLLLQHLHHRMYRINIFNNNNSILSIIIVFVLILITIIIIITIIVIRMVVVKYIRHHRQQRPVMINYLYGLLLNHQGSKHNSSRVGFQMTFCTFD